MGIYSAMLCFSRAIVGTALIENGVLAANQHLKQMPDFGPTLRAQSSAPPVGVYANSLNLKSFEL